MNLLRQIAILFTICIAGNALSALSGGALPGNVLGMVLLLILLVTQWLKLSAVESTADFFLNNMAFFFIPSTLGILRVYADIQSELAKLVIVCVATTFLTAASAGYTVVLVRRLQNRKEADKNA